MGIHDDMARQGLIRPDRGRVFAGVCAGLGRRFGMEPWPARLLFILVLLVIPGSQILVYPILWILMPSERTLAWQTSTPPPGWQPPAQQTWQGQPPQTGSPA